MILLEDKKAVIITPPHTGSGSLHRQLCGEPGRYWVISKTYDIYADHHGTDLQFSWQNDDNYSVYVVTRQAPDRVLGLFNHCNWYRKENQIGVLTFEEFIEEQPYLDWIYNTSITKFIRDNIPSHVDYDLIDYEDLEFWLDAYLEIKIDWEPNILEESKRWELWRKFARVPIMYEDINRDFLVWKYNSKGCINDKRRTTRKRNASS